MGDSDVAAAVPDAGIEPPVDCSAGLFIDVDGTLLDLAPSPGEVVVSRELVQLLCAVSGAVGGALALISGRSIAELDRLLAPLRLPSAGLHGNERRDAEGRHVRSVDGFQRLAAARATLRSLAATRRGLLFEDKGHALALHYRQVPHAEEIAQVLVGHLLPDLYPEFEVLAGDNVLEIKPAAENKGTAIEAFMREPPFAGRVPIYLGDDVTDFDGFEAARRLDGIDVAVGSRVSARWSLADPAAVSTWLGRFLTARGDRA